MAETAPLTIRIADLDETVAMVKSIADERDAALAKVARLARFALWEAVAARIGPHDFTYDLGDSSHRLDVVQIVCEALAKELGDV